MISLSPLRSLTYEYNWKMLSLVFFLTLMGVGIILISGYHISLKLTGDPFYFVSKHIRMIGVSLILSSLFLFIPTERLHQYSPYFFLFSLFLLILVFFPILGHRISGANRWVNLGFFTFQPSEIMKVSFLLFFSHFIYIKREKLNQFTFGYLPIFFILFVPVFFISLQPDFSTAVIFFFTGLLIMYASRLPFIYFILNFIITLPFIIYLFESKKYLSTRFIFFNPESDPTGKGYHIRQSLFSFKSGGFFGMDNSKIIHSIRAFPDTHTDFTFSIIARIGGLLGSLLLITVFLLFFYLGLKLANAIEKEEKKYLVVGIISLLAIEFFLHLLVSVGLIPTTGILLPFLSYGGTAQITHFILIAILLRIVYEEQTHLTLKWSNEVS